jgi:glycerol-3-phosphate acyltransferase PlsY
MWVRVSAALACGYAAGALPFSYYIARWRGGVDLRRTGSGTTSPSNVYRTVGLRPALAAGLLEVAKGAVGPLIAGHLCVLVAGLAGGLAVFAHNWPPVRYGGGGRGLSTAVGALAIITWPAALLLCAGLVVGAAVRRIFPAMSVALVLLIPMLLLLRGRWSAAAAGIILVPIGYKTLAIKWRRRRDRAGNAVSS